MKHISLRVDDKDYEFIRGLAKKKRVRESNIFREVFHDFVLRSTGQTSLTEIESTLRRVSEELRDLEVRVGHLEGARHPNGTPSISSTLPTIFKETGTPQNMQEKRRKEPENSLETSSADLTIAEIAQQLARQKGSRLEREFQKHCMLVAENASKAHDYTQSTKYYRIALELTKEDDPSGEAQRSAISEKIGDLEYLLGENDLALKYWNDSLNYYLKAETKGKAAATVYRKIGMTYILGVHDRDKALLSFKRGLELLNRDGDQESKEAAAIYESMARLYWRIGENLDEAQELCEKAIAIAQNKTEEESLPETEANALQTLGFLLPIIRKKEIFEHFQTSLKISVENGCHEAACRAYNNLGYVYIVLGGDMKRSVQTYLEGLRFERRTQNHVLYTYTKLALIHYAYIPMGEWSKAKEAVEEFLPELSTQHPHRFASAFQILGQLAFFKGEYRDAEKYLSAYLNIAEEAKEVQAIISCCISLGMLYFEKLDYARAEEYLGQALEICRKIGSRFDNCIRYSSCLSLLSRVYGKEGKLSEAVSLVSELSSIAKCIDEDWSFGFYFRALGDLNVNEGQHAEAIESFKKSIEGWKRLNWPFDIACDSYDLGLAYLMIGERDKAIEQIDYSLEIFKNLGAKAYFERVCLKREALAADNFEPPSSINQMNSNALRKE